MKQIILNNAWQILQDVHDTGEQLGLFRESFRDYQAIPNQLSEWEDLPELKHLQLVYADHPYFGRALRYFNHAPWWYRNEIEIKALPQRALLTFTNVDYYCRVWLNGELLGEHEGYSDPFTFDVSKKLHCGKNLLIVKVWSPWDNEVDGDLQELRTFLIKRNMVKGTYEHSDTFVQRDVNPVGIYGDVILSLYEDVCFAKDPEISYEAHPESHAVTLHTHCDLCCLSRDDKDIRLVLECRDAQTRELKLKKELPLPAGATSLASTDELQDVRMWNTWDRGGAWLYDITLSLYRKNDLLQQFTRKYGFRTIRMIRTAEKTQFVLNNEKLYVRGTSYFPDAYISNMCIERYERDLASMIRLGFNTLRVHVHVERPEFYALCDQYGIGVIQDSEYNWFHPVSEEFCERFIRVYLSNVKMLMPYASVIGWICMNEPGLRDPAGRLNCRAMTVSPGPALYEKITQMDPSRPAIKGSYCEEDPLSGDSHCYFGALTNGTEYTDIDGKTEKFNTEFGFDAIPCEHSLKQIPALYKRLHALVPKIADIQHYQYALLKYYIEHYRAQKYAPNSGYMQFLFNDMCPQSYYGVYDWWGLPKKGVRALEESNQPLAVFMSYGLKEIHKICIANDTLNDYGEVSVRITMIRNKAEESSHVFTASLGKDTLVTFSPDVLTYEATDCIDVTLVLEKGHQVLAINHYENIFAFPQKLPGYPSRISHEFGVRLYDA